VRETLARDYRQAFNKHILPCFRHSLLSDIKTKDLKGVSGWTDRGRTFRQNGQKRDRRVEGRDPFMELQWPRRSKTKPDLFTAEERDRIIR